MSEHGELLDAFASARRTSDDFVAMQPDVVEASRTLGVADIVELGRRANAHRAAVDVLAAALRAASVEVGPHSASGD